MTRRWLVTGCSSGLGRALAEAAAGAGDVVVATARKPDALEELVRAWPDRIVPLALDVRDAAQCEEVVRVAVDRLGGLDVLVNNAGSGVFGAVEEVGDAELHDQWETLVAGPWRLIRLLLPHLRAQGAGHIVNVSSLAGRMAFPGLSAYVAGKFALEGMSQALAAETAAFGVRVTVVEPAAYATHYGSALAEARHRIPVYAEATGGMLAALRGLEGSEDAGRPADFAQAVLGIVAASGPTPLRVPLGPGALDLVAAADAAAPADLAAARDVTAAMLPVPPSGV
ncbi:SDR family NAD(P)-dependent oxidoreductase [Streptacidiphilus monticola]|uniref:SDR family NAD(P)-dependent oxidoreductase n=1 Tax=Streptacidiphilus monticola TaxID=2161674 RepID=A0ABW1G5W0_9ACTN